VLLLSAMLKLSGQSCFNVSAGKDTTISCLANCLTLKARVPDVRTSETYQVISIPYTPYLYTTPGGTTDPLVNADDHFSDSFFLPFPFCFYGATYNKICVGSNGVITFDVLLNAKKSESFFLTAANKLPYNGGSPNNPGFYAPRASIFLAYYDMNPVSSPAGNKIEWRVEGTAPCRRFVVSFYHIGYFGTTACPNTNPANLCTMQAVLYEGTGLIDVFYENKPACPGAPGGGLSIAGVQNWGQNQAIWPTNPNTNSTVWTAINQGFRYVPSGPGSLFNRAELYKNGTLIATDLAPTVLGNGELEANFPNICQAEDSMSYVVRAFYHQCDNPAIETEGSDTIIVYKDLPAIVTTLVDAPCNGNLGKITIVSPYSPPDVEYSIDGGINWQTLNIFNVPAGTYTILARRIGNLCTSTSVPLTINQPPVFNAFSTPVSAASCNAADGSLSVTASGGTVPYQYSLDGGINWQPSNLFNNLTAGNYAVSARDAHNCIAVFPGVVTLNDTMRLELGADNSICFGSSITLVPQTNAATDTFKWTPPASLNFDTIRNPIATPTDTTKYYLTAKWGICRRTDSITINVLHKPIAHAGNDTSICYKTTATLTGSATNLSGTVNYAWAPPDSLNTPNAATSIVRIDTTRQFTLTVTDNYGCNFSISDSMWVYMHPLVFAFAGNDTNAVLNRPHQLIATGGTNYVWTPAAPLNDPFIANPLAVLNNDTYFHVQVSDDIGCSDGDDVFIQVYDGPNYYFPNAFTPNGDGLNDIFTPIPVGIRSTDYFRIFDRYGTLMYETKQYMQGWDGALKGKPAASGTYVWVIKGIDKNGSVVEMKGTVILVR